MARVPYLTQADLPDEYEQLFETDDQDPADVTLNIHRALANNPALLEAWGQWATTIYEEIGDARHRELVILAVARVSDCPYVWHAHVPLARDSGIDDEEILAIADGEYSEFSGPEQAAISYAVDHVRNSVTDETHAQVAEQFDDSDVITISILASEYARACSIIDALGVEIDDEFVGWNLDRNVGR
jgi:4-carboxymuconolactone decarboxylase